ncbi:MAG: GldG family protein, partial [Deltaproteobacteria bacterium]|nr:GldG family protein [Deltaproteobacteria bacterium]
MALRKITSGSTRVIGILLVAGIVIMINALAYRHFFRIDLTQNKQYTISPATKQILGGVDDIVNLKVYLSKKLPPYMVTVIEEVKDLLDEYRIYGKGNIIIEYIDPGDDPAILQKLRFMGIPQLQLNIIEKDQAAVTKVYMGLAVLYGDNKEIIPALTDIGSLEYELTGKILRATSAEVKTIGFLSGHGEPNLTQDLELVNRELKEQYFTRAVATAAGEKIPDNIAALVVAGPKKLTQRDLFEIDQYLMTGGRIIFLVDTIDIEERGMRGQPLGCAAEALLEHYGIRVPPELVLDQLNAQAAFQSGPYQVYVPYPFWVRTVRQSVETDHPVINSLESMVLPWASPLQLLDNSTSHYSVDILARSTEYSFTQKGVFNISPSQ